MYSDSITSEESIDEWSDSAELLSEVEGTSDTRVTCHEIIKGIYLPLFTSGLSGTAPKF